MLAEILAILPCAGDVPDAMRRMYEARQRMNTAEIHWIYLENQRADSSGPLIRYLTTQLGHHSILMTNFGDAEGFQVRSADGVPIPELNHMPQRQLVADGEIWDYQELSLVAERHVEGGDSPRPYDPRSFGLSSILDPRPLDAVMWLDPVRQPSARSYSEREEDGLRVVSAETDLGTVTWWINPAQDWSPIRVNYADRNGVTITAAEIQNRKFGSTWFPANVSFYARGFERGEIPSTVVQVESARFDDPSQPNDFSTADLGMDVGTNVHAFNATGTPEGKPLKWDGRGALDLAAYNRRSQAGELQSGEVFSRLSRMTPAEQAQVQMASRFALPPHGVRDAAYAKAFPTHWQAYTRDFIRRFALDAEQQQKAWTVCTQCEQRAREYVDKIDSRLKALETERASAKTDSDEFAAQLSKLLDPIDQIFERQLKPRLGALPTRAQRRAAEPQPAAMPQPAMTPQTSSRP